MKLVLAGAAGKMGMAILDSLYQEDDLTLVAALEKKGHPSVGKDVGLLIGVGKWGVPITDRAIQAVQVAEVVVDFSLVQNTLVILQHVQKLKRPMVIGTTGFTHEEELKIKKAAKQVPIVRSPNMSVGVNLLFKLLSDAARVLGKEYDADILEIHHRQKRDAPSGTALRIKEILAFSRGMSLPTVDRSVRQGMRGLREAGEIGIQSLRAGDVIGEHTVIFAGPGERIEMTHRAHSRNNFARGALIAARWVADKPPGLYDMLDVLGLR